MFDFNRCYNRNDIKRFLQLNFLPEDYAPTEEELYIGDTDNKVIKEVYDLGYCKSLDLKVFEMVHESENDPRVSITKQAFEILHNEGGAAQALVFFISSNDKRRYRFSLIYFDYLEVKNRIEIKTSNPRRLSFLLGEGIPCHTANVNLNNGRVQTNEDLKQRFSVEVLTESFYKELSDWYANALLKEEVKFPNCNTGDLKKDNANKAQNLIRLLTRLLFVWFMKQKNLIPDCLFDEEYLKKNILKDFDPNYSEDNLFHYKSTESIYYKAILQNLFFATLNCPIVKEGSKELQRGFRTPGQHHGINYLMRYEKYFQDPNSFVSLMNDKVPFLNGALFDCLDNKLQDPPILIDGFSDSMKPHYLAVPDYFFFGETEEDVSSFYGEKSAKTKIYGLIDILKKYNFTVEENTPVDVEVSLDPELLGKVFENLLASYNPETHETARRQTGSFYTPREIVQFMVDESLVAYLKDKTDVNEELIRDLLSYSTDTVSVDERTALPIIEAIYKCKILDPACGSGAFPMGILQQLVHMLGQLDPENKYWQEIVLRSAEEDSNATYKSNITIEEKTERIKDINASFDERLNNPDYSRKLYLIENCIYGVDIQPIAAQISKLRFFISLVVEQKPSSDKENNFGIKPLPNLDSKIVAANTLLKLHKQESDSLFTNQEVVDLQNKQKDACHRLFYAKTATTKRKYEEKIRQYRIEVSKLLKEEGTLGNEEAALIGDWDIFNQNSSAEFFDPEWMFGLDGLFDIVISNPPYIQLQANSGELAKLYENCNYNVFARTGDIYCLFYERALELLNSKGVLSFITSNKWMRAGYGDKLRGFLSRYNPLVLLDFAGTKIFKSATVDTNILIIQNANNENKTKACKANNLSKESRYYLSDFVNHNSTVMKFKTSDSWAILSPIEISIKNKIEAVGTPLKDWNIQINYGIKTGLNDAFIITTEKRNEILQNCKTEDERKRTDELIRPILRGRDIKRYNYEWNNLWLINTHNGIKGRIPRINIDDYPSIKTHLDCYWPQIKNRADQGDTPYNLRNCAYMEEFNKPTIAWQRITQENTFCQINGTCLILDSMAFLSNIRNKELFLLGVLNSKLIYFWLRTNVHEYGDKGFRLSNQYVEMIPVPIETNTILEDLVASEIDNPSSITERKIDEEIYKIYNLSKDEIAYIELRCK